VRKGARTAKDENLTREKNQRTEKKWPKKRARFEEEKCYTPVFARGPRIGNAGFDSPQRQQTSEKKKMNGGPRFQQGPVPIGREVVEKTEREGRKNGRAWPEEKKTADTTGEKKFRKKKRSPS